MAVFRLGVTGDAAGLVVAAEDCLDDCDAHGDAEFGSDVAESGVGLVFWESACAVDLPVEDAFLPFDLSPSSATWKRINAQHCSQVQQY